MKNPLVSVIIPCYNHGLYLEEAIDSVLKSKYDNYEIIVIDDQSNELSTRVILDNLDKPQTRVLRNKNKGVASARNMGVQNAEGKYILPLDADDKISDQYISDAVEVLESNPKVGIVYAKARLFGKEVGEWKLPPFSIERMLASNIIFCSAFFRKEDWERVNGFKCDIPYGKEDWEFWLCLLELEREVYCLPQTHFYYRKSQISRDTVASEGDNRKAINAYIYTLHKGLYDKYLPNPLQLYQENTYLKIVLNRFEYRLIRKLCSPTLHFIKKIMKIPG